MYSWKKKARLCQTLALFICCLVFWCECLAYVEHLLRDNEPSTKETIVEIFASLAAPNLLYLETLVLVCHRQMANKCKLVAILSMVYSIPSHTSSELPTCVYVDHPPSIFYQQQSAIMVWEWRWVGTIAIGNSLL